MWVQTLRAWEKSGELVPDRRSKGGVRCYDVGKIMGLGNEDMPTVAYARVSSHDQKNDLVRQSELLEAFCAAKGWRHEVIADLGSGLNYRKKGLNHLVFSARLYGSRSHKTKRLLAELNDDKNAIVTKSMSPDVVPDEAVRNLLRAMEDAQFKAMLLYAKFLEERDAARP